MVDVYALQKPGDVPYLLIVPSPIIISAPPSKLNSAIFKVASKQTRFNLLVQNFPCSVSQAVDRTKFGFDWESANCKDQS
jgi:hypothetical protein